MKNMRFKEGDRVRIKSLDWYNENKDENTDFNTPLVLRMTSKMSLFCDGVVTIKEVHYNYYSIYEDNNTYCWTDEMIEGLVEEEMSLDKAGQITDFEYEGLVVSLPEGYIYKDENGNVINTTKIVLEKKEKEYPKTYTECCNILHAKRYHGSLLESLQKLLICRDAYWKLYGEEMGLGKPWGPEYKTLVDNTYFTIHTFNGEIVKSTTSHRNAILAFPTEEIRDAFKENFDPDIEICKELL